jgi:hypothetical protein
MNAYELSEYLKAFVADKTDYDQDYLLHAAQVLILQAHEVKALIEQNNELREQLNAVR